MKQYASFATTGLVFYPECTVCKIEPGKALLLLLSLILLLFSLLLVLVLLLFYSIKSHGVFGVKYNPEALLENHFCL